MNRKDINLINEAYKVIQEEVPLRCPNCKDNLGKDIENPKHAFCGNCGKSFFNPRGYDDEEEIEEEHKTNLKEAEHNKFAVGYETLNRLETEHGGIDWKTAEIEEIDMSDYPDFSNAYLTKIDFNDGTPVPDELVEFVQDGNQDKFYDVVYNRALG